jgi:HAD superfamily hydrolase (TIGR01509 family)
MATNGSSAALRKGVLFDIDGTLVDDNYLHVVAWWQAFRAHNHDVSMTDVHSLIGKGSTNLVKDLIGREDEEVVTAHSHFYGPSLEGLRCFPGARDLLYDCKKRGLAVVLATSADPGEVEMLTRALDADDALDAVTGAKDAGAAKPDPQILIAAMKKADLQPENCVMVGDTVWDVEASIRAGLPCIAVLSGGIARDQLAGAGAAAIYRDVAELRRDLDGSPIGRLVKAGPATG